MTWYENLGGCERRDAGKLEVVLILCRDFMSSSRSGPDPRAASTSPSFPCPSPPQSPAPQTQNHPNHIPSHMSLVIFASAPEPQRTPSCLPCSRCRQTDSNEASCCQPRQSKHHQCAPQHGSGTAVHWAWSGTELPR